MNNNKILILTFGSVFALASCGGQAPAPWSKPDDSPWKEKHDSAAMAAPADEVIYEPLVVEPDPEPVGYQPAAMDELAGIPAPSDMAMERGGGSGMPMPETVEAEAMEMQGSTEDMVMAMPAGSYAVQVYASKTETAINRFQENRGLDELNILKTDRDGVIYYVLVGLYEDRAAAQAAAAELQEKSGSQPWVRSISGLQKIVAR